MSDLTLLPVSELANLVRARKVSPVELTQSYLENIERYNGAINAYVTVTPELAMADARRAEDEITRGHYKGALHGIPIAHKDIYCTADVRTTCCSEVLRDYVPDFDATVVKQWRDAGTVMLGKLNTHEFAYGTRNISSSFGPVHNPWRLDCHTGGSSGGSAAAVLMGMCAAATGSDSGGSIRMPSAATGVTGLKPTFGLGSRFGVFPLMWTMDHPGPMARTALDCALLLQPMAAHDANDKSTVVRKYPDFSWQAGKGVHGLRIGIPRRYFYDEAEEIVEAKVLEAVDVLKSLGAELVEVDIEYIEHAATASGVLHLAEAAAYHDDVFSEHPELYTPETRRNLELGSYVLAKDYLHAQRYRSLLGNSFRNVFRQVDVVAMPTISLLATPIDQHKIQIRGKEKSVHLSMLHNTEPIDLTGLPALSVPCGFAPDNRPIGLQIVGRPFDESLLVRVGHAFQRATDWHLKRPASLDS
jgi:aspartyl-tRNA(Asn)/glutamyl-tRNA(Gln) amidotransferase subunit A